MECGQDGVSIRLVSVHGSETTICVKAFITFIRLTVAAPKILADNVFSTGILHLHLLP
jgi:hypothetical protein